MANNMNTNLSHGNIGIVYTRAYNEYAEWSDGWVNNKHLSASWAGTKINIIFETQYETNFGRLQYRNEIDKKTLALSH